MMSLEKSLNEGRLRILHSKEPLKHGDQFTSDGGGNWYSVNPDSKRHPNLLYARFKDAVGPPDERDYYLEDVKELRCLLKEAHDFWSNYSSLNESAQYDLESEKIEMLARMESLTED